MDLKDRLRKLRKALGATQEDIAERGGLDLVEVSNLESGRNQATSIRILKGIAAGFGLSLQDASDLVDGALPVEGALAKIRGAAPHVTTPDERRLHAAEIARQDGVSEAAVQHVLTEPPGDPQRSTLWWAMRMKRLDLYRLMGDAAKGGMAVSAPDESGEVRRPRPP
jgi:DNA-binding XRE family transcriptional regulator